MTRAGLWTSLAGLAVLTGLLALVPRALRDLPNDEGPRRPKIYSRVLGEEVRVTRRGLYGVDVIRCGRARLEKRRRGPLSFGGLNVLVLEDLALTLPLTPICSSNAITLVSGTPATSGTSGTAETSATTGTTETAETSATTAPSPTTAAELLTQLGVTKDLLRAHGVAWRFSGLRIERLAVSTLDGAKAAPLFTAASGEVRRDGLHLRDCIILSNAVPAAVLQVKPVLRLVWSDTADALR